MDATAEELAWMKAMAEVGLMVWPVVCVGSEADKLRLWYDGRRA